MTSPEATSKAPDVPSVYVLGAGNVGLGLALALQARGLVLCGLWNRGAQRAELARRALACPVTTGPLPTTLGKADIIVLAVSDAAIAPLAVQLAHHGLLLPGMLLVHVSGCLSAAVLRPPPGVHAGSMHPLLACPSPEVAQRDLQTAFYTLEGAEPVAIGRLSALVAKLGGRSQMIHSEAKARYHAAAVMASNGMVALLKMAVEEARGAGLDKLDEPLTRLALGALEKALALGVAPSLTGPALRGDAATVRRHVASLSPLARQAYAPLTKAALDIALQRGLDAPMAQAVLAALDDTTN